MIKTVRFTNSCLCNSPLGGDKQHNKQGADGGPPGVSILHNQGRLGSLFPNSLLLCMREDVGLEVGGLCELLVAAVEGADVGPVPGVDPHVRPQVEV